MLDNYLDFFEIPVSFLDKNIEELSGGEKQRIAIINALLLERKIFLLDEISSSLDNSLKIKTIDFFLTKPDFTVLYISHDKYLPKGFDIRTIKFDVL
jgi:putative ABC transport system ATP-binding protein